jgi:hypothetical protein
MGRISNNISQCGYNRENFFPIKIINDYFIIASFRFPYDHFRLNSTDYFKVKLNPRPQLDIDETETIEEIRQTIYYKKIFDENQTYFYLTILKTFQKVKKAYNLDDDEYLQLIVNFVQSLPYFTEKRDVKYPLETFADGCGDCDDKSILLLSLLFKENYNVSLISIPPEGPNLSGHAMAGVASDSATIKKKGYAMIETTKKDSAIGAFPSNVVSEDVLVVKIGNGSKTYETHSSTVVSAEGMFRVIKKGQKIVSITPYHQEYEILDFFRTQKENYDWQNDCENGIISSSICRIASTK